MFYFSEPHKFHRTDQMPSLTQSLRSDVSQNPEVLRLWEEAEHMVTVSRKHTPGNTHPHSRETTHSFMAVQGQGFGQMSSAKTYKKTFSSGSLLSFEI